MRELICALVLIAMLTACGGGSMTDIPVALAPPGSVPLAGDPDQPPVTDSPVTDSPVTDSPVTDPPVTDPPVTDPPVTDPPVTEPSVTDPPVTDPPVTAPPVTNPPVTNPPVTEPPVQTATGGPALGIDTDSQGRRFVRLFSGIRELQSQTLGGFQFQPAGDVLFQTQSSNDVTITLEEGDEPQLVKVYTNFTGSTTLTHNGNSITFDVTDEGKSYHYPKHDPDSIVGNVTVDNNPNGNNLTSEKYYYLGEKPVKVSVVDPPPAPTTAVPIRPDGVRHAIHEAYGLQNTNGTLADLDTSCMFQSSGCGSDGGALVDLDSYEGYGNWGRYYLFSTIKGVHRETGDPVIVAMVGGYPSNSLPDVAPNIQDVTIGFQDNVTVGEQLTYTGVVAGRIATPGGNFGRRVRGRAELTYQVNAIADKHGLPVQNYHWDRVHQGANIVGPWMTAEFTQMQRVNGTKEYPDHDWGNIYDVHENGTFKKEDADNRLYGQFYGPDHADLAGTFELHTEGDAVIGSFGTSPRR